MTIQKKATLIASFVAGILALIKLSAGLVSGSVALLASAMDSILDLAVSLFNYVALHGSEKPADAKFNYGRGKLEALSSVIEGTIIAMSGFFIIYESFDSLYNGKEISHVAPAVAVMCTSFIMTFFLVLFLSRVAKVSGSMVVRADLLHYKVDLLSNGTVLVSLLLVFVIELHFIDALVGAGIAIYIIYSAISLIKDGIYTLLDRAMSKESERKIREILDSSHGIIGYHALRTREAGSVRFIDVHLVFRRDYALFEAHAISDKIEERIRALDSTVSWNITTHLDPYDDSRVKEYI